MKKSNVEITELVSGTGHTSDSLKRKWTARWRQLLMMVEIGNTVSVIETEKRIGLVFIRWPWWDRLPERFFFAEKGSSSWRQESEENVLVIN